MSLCPHCCVDSVPFWSKKSNNLTFTILSIALQRTLVLEHLDDNLKGSLCFPSGFDIRIIVDSNHFSVKYPCCNILPYEARRESNPFSGRCFNISLWILSGQGANFFVAWIGLVNLRKAFSYFSLLVWFTCIVFCSSFCFNATKAGL